MFVYLHCRAECAMARARARVCVHGQVDNKIRRQGRGRRAICSLRRAKEENCFQIKAEMCVKMYVFSTSS